MEIILNELPRYSPWCMKILGFEKTDIHPKTPKEVNREYNDEKWKQVCMILQANPSIDVEEMEETLYGTGENVVYDCGKFYLMNSWDSRQKLYEMYHEKMKPYLVGAKCIVELGAGYGSVILNLLPKILKEGIMLDAFAGEYTDTGIKALRQLAFNVGINIRSGRCDFFSLKKEAIFENAKNGVVFTSWATAYVPKYAKPFVDYLCEFNPRYVIHFEPCYEFYSMQTLHGQMCRRYMQINDYNRNLVSVLREAERCEKIEIVKIDENFWGSNPLAPISMIVWKPVLRDA